MSYTINVNGKSRTVDVAADTPLLWVLRDELDLKGTKFGCGIGLCGACTVHIDGRPTRSCATPISRSARRVTTIEAIGETPSARWCRRRGSSGRHAVRLLPGRPDHVRRGAAHHTPKPTDKDIDKAMSGNICRCRTYTRIRAAIKRLPAFRPPTRGRSNP